MSNVGSVDYFCKKKGQTYSRPTRMVEREFFHGDAISQDIPRLPSRRNRATFVVPGKPVQRS